AAGGRRRFAALQRNLNRHRTPNDKGWTARSTIMAASWWEASSEARFKQVNGDFVFRAPGIVPQHYLVSATQKAELHRSLRASRGFVFDRYTILILVVMAFVFMVFEEWVEVNFWRSFVSIFEYYGLFWLIRQWGDLKTTGPALVGARYTDRRIAWRERTETLSRLLPLSNMIATGVALALVAIGGALALITVPQRFGLGIFSPDSRWLGVFWGAVAFCALGAGYYFYLAALNVLRRQRPQTMGEGRLEGPESRA